MPIEITGQPGTSVNRNGSQDTSNVTNIAQKPEQQQTGSGSTQDTVSLTQRASQLQRLENTLADLPVVDTQRVERIRQSIATGSFEIDSSRVADKLLNFEQSLGV